MADRLHALVHDAAVVEDGGRLGRRAMGRHIRAGPARACPWFPFGSFRRLETRQRRAGLAPGNDAAQRFGRREPRGQAVLVETIARPGAGEEGVVVALHRLQLRLCQHGAGAELRVVIAEFAEGEVRRRLLVGFSVTKSGLPASMPCRRFIQ